MYDFMRFLPEFDLTEFDLNAPQYGENFRVWQQDWASSFSLDATPLFNQPVKINTLPPLPLSIGENLTTERISVADDGTQADSNSSTGAISADGRYVAFTSRATNLVPGDTNMAPDIFIYDRNTDTIEMLPLAGGVLPGSQLSMSSDGRYITFRSSVDLVVGDVNGELDIFIYDRDTDVIELVSITDSGVQGNSGSFRPSMSDDGRHVVFSSSADNFVAFDTNGEFDIFVVDRVTDILTRVNVSNSGAQANDFTENAFISGDGLFVVFQSDATNLVAGDSNGETDIFVYDLTAGSLERVSLTNGGAQGNDVSLNASISSDGRYVAFESLASNLVAGDTNLDYDIFVHDRLLNTTERVSIASDGTQANAGSGRPTISADGRYVSFVSAATNLVTGDTNGFFDIFVYDRTTGTVQLVSAASDGTQGDDDTVFAEISADGSFVVYEADATNLVAGDTNNETDIFITEIAAGSGNIIDGTAGDDTLVGTAGNDTINGFDGNDRLLGKDGNDIINGGAGNDFLTGRAGDDDLFGGDGNDILRGDAGADDLDGGAGTDTASYRSATALVTISGGAGTGGDAAGDTYTSIERWWLSDFADVVTGTAADEIYFGFAGDDTIDGGAGVDILVGGAGMDTLNGGAGDDLVFGGDDNDTLSGGNGRDYILGGNGNDRIEGGSGNDHLNGNAGADVYIINENSFNTDYILGWEDGTDMIEIGLNVSNTADFSDLTVTQSGANVLVTFNDPAVKGRILILGETASNIDAADFDFLAPPPGSESDDGFAGIEAVQTPFDNFAGDWAFAWFEAELDFGIYL